MRRSIAGLSIVPSGSEGSGLRERVYQSVRRPSTATELTTDFCAWEGRLRRVRGCASVGTARTPYTVTIAPGPGVAARDLPSLSTLGAGCCRLLALHRLHELDNAAERTLAWRFFSTASAVSGQVHANCFCRSSCRIWSSSAAAVQDSCFLSMGVLREKPSCQLNLCTENGRSPRRCSARRLFTRYD